MSGPSISDRIGGLPRSGIRGIMELALELEDVVRLEIGDPDFATPAHIGDAAAEAARAGFTHYSPGVGLRSLRELIAEKVQGRNGLVCTPDEVAVTTGACGGLFSTFLALLDPGDEVLVPDPGWTTVVPMALAAGVTPVPYRLDRTADFALDPGAVDRALREGRPNIVFFARPNNPTGTMWPSSLVADVARAHPDVLVVSDEAYAAYAGDGMADAVAALPNLLVMRTLSKIGLAALRIGYLRASRGIIAEVEKIRPPYNLGALNQRAAVWLLRNHRALLDGMCADVVRERDRLSTTLAAMPGVRAFSSQANLILFRVGSPGDGRATAVWQRLCATGVLVRCFDRPGLLSGCLRVTVGTPTENDRFLAALKDALQN